MTGQCWGVITVQRTTGNIPRALGVGVYFPSVSAIMLRKNNISLSPSPENLLKWACVRTELEPQPPSLITILEGIGKEIPPAVQKKEVRKACGEEGTWAFNACFHDIGH